MVGLLKKYAFVIIAFCFLACSPFSKVADATVIESEAPYISVSNTQAEFKSLTFGDFEFARNRKELKKIGGSAKGFREILVYAKTTRPIYEYCIMYEPENLSMDNPEFTFIDTLLQGKRVVLAISKSAPARDVTFIRNNIYLFSETSNPEKQ